MSRTAPTARPRTFASSSPSSRDTAPPISRPTERPVAGAVAAVRVAAAEQLTELEVLSRQAAGCTRCRLHEGRTQVVFGNGNPDAGLMFVGEAPGFHEDKQGLPFVGQAGRLLHKRLAAVGATRAGGFAR